MKKRSSHADSPEQIVTQLRDLLVEAEQLVGDSAGEFVSEKATAVRERLSDAKERLEDLYENARDKVVAGARTTDDTIRSHPYQSIAIALGLGLLIGTVIGRNRN